MSKALSELKKIPERLRKLWGGVKSFFTSSKLRREEPPAIEEASAMDIRQNIKKCSQDIDRYKKHQQRSFELIKKYISEGVNLAASNVKSTSEQQTLAQSLTNFINFKELIDTKRDRINKLTGIAKTLEKVEQAQTIATTERFPIEKASLKSATDPLIGIVTAINKAQAELKTLQEKERAANGKVNAWQGYADKSAQNLSADTLDLHLTNLSGLREAKKELGKVQTEIRTKNKAIIDSLKTLKIARGLAPTSPSQATNSPPSSLSPPPPNYQGQNSQHRK